MLISECLSFTVTVVSNVDENLTSSGHDVDDTNIIPHLCNIDAQTNFVMICSDTGHSSYHIGRHLMNRIGNKRAQTFSFRCGVVVRRGGVSSHRRRPRHLTMVQNYEVRRQAPLT
ncbi:hypothetical protein TNCV_2636841 [Trichonephila clavipes]|uniref:Uncharacterized protein n=1 Tax=Trichonephila clavipes TaxID=2585209 RepID=A0A8X6UYZ4_TRICX|nr:hypothetical protein TNCV_2636841 [Trichonephila clavipes]